MTTQTFRVLRVRSVAQSPVARIEAINEDGHELRLEVPSELARGAGEGQLLLIHWSLHNQAVAPAQSGAARPSRADPAAIVDAEFTTTNSTRVTTSPAQDPAAVDQEFMSLMRGRSSKTFTSRDIDHELSILLGSAGAKGQK